MSSCCLRMEERWLFSIFLLSLLSLLSLFVVLHLPTCCCAGQVSGKVHYLYFIFSSFLLSPFVLAVIFIPVHLLFSLASQVLSINASLPLLLSRCFFNFPSAFSTFWQHFHPFFILCLQFLPISFFHLCQSFSSSFLSRSPSFPSPLHGSRVLSFLPFFYHPIFLPSHPIFLHIRHFLSFSLPSFTFPCVTTSTLVGENVMTSLHASYTHLSASSHVKSL